MRLALKSVTPQSRRLKRWGNEMEYETRTTSMTVVPVGQPLFSEMATTITIVDEAAGEYVEVCQSGRHDVGKIAINAEEWPALQAAISLAISNCRGEHHD